MVFVHVALPLTHPLRLVKISHARQPLLLLSDVEAQLVFLCALWGSRARCGVFEHHLAAAPRGKLSLTTEVVARPLARRSLALSLFPGQGEVVACELQLGN